MSSLVFSPILYPPLGSTSTCPISSPIRFHALMQVVGDEIPSVDPETKFTVLLWYSTNGRGVWSPAHFKEIEFDHGVIDVQGTVSKRRDLFVLDLEYDAQLGPLQFCLKYRFGEGPWLWAGSRIGGLDGRVVFNSPELKTFLQIFNLAELGWEARPIEADGDCQVWDVSCFGRGEGILNVSLGKPVGSIEQWMALVKIATPWMGPLHGRKAFSVDKDALLVVFQRVQDGGHVVLLPVSGLGGGSAYITSDPEDLGGFIVRSMGDHEHVPPEGRKVQLIIGFGENALETVAATARYLKKRVMTESNRLSGTPTSGLQALDPSIRKSLGGNIESWRSVIRQERYKGCESGPSQEPATHDVVLEALSGLTSQPMSSNDTFWGEGIARSVPAATKSLGIGVGRPDSGTSTPGNKEDPGDRVFWEDGVSYCTWNGLGWDLSEERILQAVKALEDRGIIISNLMVDDNWQSLAGRNYGSSGTWSSFEANPKFPGGLKGFVRRVRQRFPYIKHIGVWHALHGYWDGVTPDSPLAMKYKTIRVAWRDNVNSSTKLLTMIAPEDIEMFYDEFYRFLSDCGIDSAKTDVQCRIDELTSGRDKAKLARAYQVALKKSSAKYFDRRVIYCMSHVPQILYHALLPEGGPRPFLRTSDDFYPDVPQSHGWHIFANAMNMILFSQLHILPDWDMFQTSLPTYASLHAAARCLSGGPIFITDSPNSHNFALMSAMASPTPSENFPMRVLRPDRIAHAVDPYIGYHSNRLLCIQNVCSNGTIYFLGVFNVAPMRLTELVESFWLKNGEWVIRGYTGGMVKRAVRGLLVVDLEMWSWEIFTASQVNDNVAVLGIKENITGAAAVVKWHVQRDGAKRVIEVEMRALGTLVVYIKGIGNQPKGYTLAAFENLLPDTMGYVDERRETLEIDMLSVNQNTWGYAGTVSVRITLYW